MKPQLMIVARFYGCMGVALTAGGVTRGDAYVVAGGVACLLGGLVLWRSVRGRWL